jgi:sporulation protein YlmC with PRC-barrel domain
MEVFKMVKNIVLAVAVAGALTGAAVAQQTQTTTGVATTPTRTETLTTLPNSASTVTNWYKQNVYDSSDTKIGEISDVLIDKDGKVNAFIVGVGGFLGIGEKDVAVPFSAVRATERNGKWWLTMDATKDSLKGAAGYKYDKTKASWVPA